MKIRNGRVTGDIGIKDALKSGLLIVEIGGSIYNIKMPSILEKRFVFNIV